MKTVCNVTTGQVIATRARMAETWLDRTIGFLARKSIHPEEALWLTPCASFHTLGMQQPLDVVFLDAENRVVRVLCSVPRNRFPIVCRGAVSVVEFAPGALTRSDVLIGDRFSLE